jgi:L-ribulose-5-phosphate 3-epimerase
MAAPIRLAAITDEFSPDLDVALDAMRAAGLTGAELRLIGARNILDLSDTEIDRVRGAVEARGMTIISIAAPLLKCVLPNGPPLDPRLQQDVFGSSYTFADQAHLTDRAFAVAQRTGAPLIRVFSYWRTIDPAACDGDVISALRTLAEGAAELNLMIGLENEFACNVGTGHEAARILAALKHDALGALWDPANALVLGETAYPDGYRALPFERVLHVHAKDCIVQDGQPVWGPLGERAVGWAGQIAALVRDGYSGWISLETHWRGDHGDRVEASTICARNLQRLLSFEEKIPNPNDQIPNPNGNLT